MKSIKALREQGRRFWSTWHNSFPDFEALGSMCSDVALVGHFLAGCGLLVSFWIVGGGLEGVRSAPLVVPTGK